MADLYKIARPLLFKLDAERAHHLTLSSMRLAHQFGLLRKLLGPRVMAQPTEVMGLTFPNRIGLAAGMDKNAAAFEAFGAVGFGHVEVGTVTPRSQPGNEKPRLFRLVEHNAVINRMGFNNIGIDRMLENIERSHARYGPFRGVLGINIGKNFDTPNENAVSDYLACFKKASPVADYIAINLSSPNTAGLRDLQGIETCRALVEELQAERDHRVASRTGKRTPLVVKIAPDLSDEHIDDLAGVFNTTRIDGVIATNTTISREAVAGHPLADEKGGLSGAPVTQRSTEVIRRLRTVLDPDIPIIGVGGINCAQDAADKLDAGAALVQVYTGLIYRGPELVREIAEMAAGRDD